MKEGVTLEEHEALMNLFSDYLKESEFSSLATDYDLNKELESIERDRIIQALSTADGNQKKAAEILKIGRTCLIAKMKKFNLS